jgi:Domain of unknown function (DUF4386)
MNWERSARASGAVFVVLAVAAFVIAGESPKVSDSAEEVVNYFDSNRNQLIVGALLFATGFVFFLWFAAAVANHLREHGEGRVAATVLVAGAAFAAVQFVVMALFATLAFSVAGAGDATLTKALYDLDVGLDNLDGLAAGLFVLAAAVGLKRTASIPAWLAWAGLGVAALFFLRATTWASEGFWSPTGDYILIAILCGLAWILVTSIVLFVREPREQSTREATTAPAV